MNKIGVDLILPSCPFPLLQFPYELLIHLQILTLIVVITDEDEVVSTTTITEEDSDLYILCLLIFPTSITILSAVVGLGAVLLFRGITPSEP